MAQKEYDAIFLALANFRAQVEAKGFQTRGASMTFYEDSVTLSFGYSIDKDWEKNNIYVHAYEGREEELLAGFAEQLGRVVPVEDARKIELSRVLTRAASLGSDMGLGAAFVAALTAEAEALASNALTHQPKQEDLI